MEGVHGSITYATAVLVALFFPLIKVSSHALSMMVLYTILNFLLEVKKFKSLSY